MKPEKVHAGATVRVREHHRIAERRGTVRRIADHYGGEGYMAVDVCFSGGHRRLFWPEDLEEISSPRPWWRSLLGITSAEWVLSGLIILTCLHASQPRSSWASLG
jgi:hypothetical protein